MSMLVKQMIRQMAEDENRSTQIAIRVTPTLRAAIEELAAADKRKFSAYCAIVLEQHVAEKLAKQPKKR